MMPEDRQIDVRRATRDNLWWLESLAMNRIIQFPGELSLIALGTAQATKVLFTECVARPARGAQFIARCRTSQTWRTGRTSHLRIICGIR